MISRSSALAIADAYTKRFTYASGSSRAESVAIHRDQLYDFLFEHDYEPWFCNLAKSPASARTFKEFWMRIHTGESLAPATDGWTWEQRSKLGQSLLKSLARDHLRFLEHIKKSPFGQYYTSDYKDLLRRLELDGYVFRDQELYQQQADLVDVEAERNILQVLYEKANLQRSKDAFEFLRLGEEHFVASRWSDCISNVRKFLELTLQEGARAVSQVKGTILPEASLARPVDVRSFLESSELMEKKERELLDKLYGLLSETGAHPYMAESDQARLLRQMSLTWAQFVLLRLAAISAPDQKDKAV